MTSPPTHYDDVVGVEVTIDGMLVIADRLNVMDFPVALGIRLNIPQEDLRNIVWEQVARDLTAQGVLDVFGEPHPEVAAMVDTLSRADRTLEGRWWRRDVGGNLKGIPEGCCSPTCGVSTAETAFRQVCSRSFPAGMQSRGAVRRRGPAGPVRRRS